MDEQEVRWSAPEYRTYEKGPLWYWILGTGAAIVVIFALIQNNFLFVLFTGIATVLLMSWGKRAPENIDIIISRQGIRIGKATFYPADKLNGFAFAPNPNNEEQTELIIGQRRRLGDWIKLLIPTARVEAARTTLATYLPEVEYRESMVDRLRHQLKF